MFRKKGPSEVEIAQENEVKIGITQEFAQALKTVQKENIGTADQAVYSTDTANSVCNCLEAVFLHGLKSKALNKIASYVGVGQQATVQTNLNFWGLVSRITHSEVIAQLKHLGQITTEVGLCRAWVRVALNDGIMESYIDAIVADVKTLEYYYQRTAYLRDSEQPEIMKSYLQGLMHFQFKLSYNASVLNEWAYPPLLLAGVIDSKDAPPPIIKHPVTQPVEAQPKTSSSHQNLEPVDPDPNNSVEKLLNELGIEDVEESVELVKDEIETSDKKSLEEKDAHAQETVTDSKPNIDISQPILIEEKVKIESDDDNERIGGRTTASPKKKKKGKSRSSLEKLKPQLSLSPPNSEALPPELSDATADKVDRIETDGKSEYFAKHRLSLPAVSPMHDKSRSAKRKSLPNVLEKPSSSPHTIEDYLYGTGPLEEEDEVVDGDGTAIGNGNKSEDDVIDPEEDELKRREAGMDPRQSVGNNLMFSGRGWSSSIGSEGTDTFDAASPPRSTESFGTLLQNYTPASSLSTKSIDDVLATLPERRTTIISPVVSSPNENELSRMCQFSEIANEKGLDAQNFQCKGCSRSIGLIFGKPRTCKFDGWYYCYECHENDEYYIPALIVHNWDFRKQKVCKKNFEYLQDKEEQPYINVEDINPRLYEHVPEMLEIQDLLQVPTGSLASSLRKVIKFATKHVYSCRLCSQKGFICELCNNPKVIYAFEMDATFRCPQCKTVFHKACKTDNRPCPKCQRRQHRQSLHGSNKPLLTPDYDSHVDQV
ncbi:PKHM3-like protein [Mya arenaria]|uniref:PKHM3-like protein n=1 Tax=Mya arenaria TaxID=6604 RepID=A0ABY7F3K3_MYAAR|nr:PKHM3-like protein [Mya arenaria]